MSYIGERKWSYFHPPEKFRYCSGANAACQNLEAEGYKVIPWNDDARDLPIDTIRLLHLEPTKQQLKKAVLPSFVPNLSRLEHAVFDLHFLNKQTTFPKTLRSLVLSRNLEHDYLGKQLAALDIAWPEKVFKKLKALLLIADREKDTLIQEASSKRFPKLKFLGFQLSNQRQLSVFKQFDNLTDLEITGLQDYSLFESIAHLPLVSLDLGGLSKTFLIGGITSIKSLEFIRLNSIRAEIDCKLFRELPNLKEIVILNSKNIRNVEALLDCPNLKSVDFLDCNNPFKGVAKKFLEHGFEHLSIKYA